MEGLRVRLLPPMTGSPAWNMAVDEALLRTVGQGRARPTLRFYRWQPPALSVGRFQSLGGQVRLEILQAEGIGLVRRPTGGRAVLPLNHVLIVRFGKKCGDTARHDRADSVHSDQLLLGCLHQCL